MPTRPVLATAEGMPIPALEGPTAEVEFAQDIVSVLAVCAYTTQRIADGDEDAADLAGDLARCLTWARDLARQNRDDLEMAQRIARSPRR